MKRERAVYLAVGAIVVLALGFVGIPYIYIHFFDKTQAPLTVNSFPTTSAPSSPTADASPTGDPSPATTSATGRTSSITGSLTVAGGSVTQASFSTDLATVTSDQAQRDNQFRGRIMDVAQYPTPASRSRRRSSWAARRPTGWS
ncbi:MAG TPA: YceI family protein [Actinomycetota bacterium]|nr:YceI family protein [Actinomycetota bacterium]